MTRKKILYRAKNNGDGIGLTKEHHRHYMAKSLGDPPNTQSYRKVCRGSRVNHCSCLRNVAMNGYSAEKWAGPGWGERIFIEVSF